MVFRTQKFFLFSQELIHFAQEILPLLPKKLRTPYLRNLRVPTHEYRATYHGKTNSDPNTPRSVGLSVQLLVTSEVPRVLRVHRYEPRT